ncbi:hypothetical protein TNCV_4401671 [Trichonephila clavipes]|nr:hypothetical protein TNCV_4401671 [Trichonephila clavipes]
MTYKTEDNPMQLHGFQVNVVPPHLRGQHPGPAGVFENRRFQLEISRTVVEFDESRFKLSLDNQRRVWGLLGHQ